jgi:hypothetical protein
MLLLDAAVTRPLASTVTLGAWVVDPKEPTLLFTVANAGEGEKPVAVATMTFEVFYITALGAPDVAL